MAASPAKKAKLDGPGRAEAAFRGFVDLQASASQYTSACDGVYFQLHHVPPLTLSPRYLLPITQINGWGGVDFSGSKLTEENAAKAFDDVRVLRCVVQNLRLFLNMLLQLYIYIYKYICFHATLASN